MAANPIYIPTFIGSITYAPVRVLPHIYFYNGTKNTNTYFIGGYGATTSSLNIVSQSAFPYFDNYSGNTPTTESLSLLFNNEAAVYGEAPTASLYTTYWEKYISLLYNPRTRLINCEGIIPLADYFKMELNDIVEWRGNYYHLRAMNEYNLKNGEVKLQLLGPILEDVITNILPELECNFTFTQIVATPTTTTTIAPNLNVDYLIVAGGGGGAAAASGGGAGGGAGGLLSGSLSLFTGSTYPITIGAGGGFGLNSVNGGKGFNGGNSTAFGLTAIGGGGGGVDNGSLPAAITGSTGGSGGGGGGGARSAGLGTAGQGFNGGTGSVYKTGGGGGSAQLGGNGSIINGYGGHGGSGSQWLDGNYYAAGGGGSAMSSSNSTINGFGPGDGGFGGGGIGGYSNSSSPVTGSTAGNATGYGCGGGGRTINSTGENTSGSGSAGIVIVRYQSAIPLFIGGNITYSGSFTYHTFTASASLIPNTPTTTTLAPTTTTTLAPTTTTTTISASCSTWQITNSNPSIGGQVTYVPCGGAGYRDIFVPQSTTITLCVQNGQIQNVVGYASSSLTNLSTSCTSSLQNCISYTIRNTGGAQYTYSGKNCSNCATTFYSINGGATVVRCFVSGTFSTSFPTFVTATAGANCNVSGSGCPI